MVLKLVDLVLMLKLDTTKLFKKQIIKIKIYFLSDSYIHMKQYIEKFILEFLN